MLTSDRTNTYALRSDAATRAATIGAVLFALPNGRFVVVSVATGVWEGPSGRLSETSLTYESFDVVTPTVRR